MRVETYLLLKNLITDAGFGGDVAWAENLGECQSADDFAMEHAFVVCNSGMRAKTACGIFEKVRKALAQSRPLSEVFGHKHKCYSIQYVYDHRVELFEQYKVVAASDKTETKDEILAFLTTLPHIGDTIKYHLFKNMGGQVCKPDRHLVRIAAFYETTPHDLCSALAAATGDRITTVDTVIWRSASLEIIKFRKDNIPSIPNWPFEQDTIDVICPNCARRSSANIRYFRQHGLTSWPDLCSVCEVAYQVEPVFGGLRVSLIDTEMETATATSGGQLDLLDTPTVTIHLA